MLTSVERMHFESHANTFASKNDYGTIYLNALHISVLNHHNIFRYWDFYKPSSDNIRCMNFNLLSTIWRQFSQICTLRRQAVSNSLITHSAGAYKNMKISANQKGSDICNIWQQADQSFHTHEGNSSRQMVGSMWLQPYSWWCTYT